MPKWNKELIQLLEDLVENQPDLALKINSTAIFLKKHPLSGELALRPSTRYYTDPESKFRITYEIEKDDILITVIRVF